VRKTLRIWESTEEWASSEINWLEEPIHNHPVIKKMTTYLVKRYASDHDFMNNLSSDMSGHTILDVMVRGTYFYVVYS
jgi:hypothetical protein